MSITPKSEFIEKVLEIRCKHCPSKQRIKRRLEEELGENEFDCDKHIKADEIIKREG